MIGLCKSNVSQRTEGQREQLWACSGLQSIPFSLPPSFNNLQPAASVSLGVKHIKNSNSPLGGSSEE